MVRGGHGEAVWNRVRERAGVQVEVFVSTDPYPDDVTYRLVAAASEELAMPPDEILKGFGEYWVLHTAVEAYGPMLRMAGRTLRDFLLYLPRFHVHVQTVFPELRPPDFVCENVGEHSLDLHYYSPRPAGLEPFVEGLILGLGKLFETPVQVRLVGKRDADSDHSVFHVAWEPKAG